MKTIFASVVLLMSMNSFAAVAPYYDQINRIQAVLDSDELYKSLQGQMIQNIKVLEHLEIEVTTSQCQVTATLAAHAPSCNIEGHPVPCAGMTTYTVQSLSQPNCQ